jgi:hypothetical protein
VIIDYLDLFDPRDRGPLGAFGVQPTFNRELYTLGVEGFPIVELHTPAQLEFPGIIINKSPGFGQMGTDFQGFLVPVHEIVIKMPSDDVIDSDVMELRV